jgi:hypothetical protein
MLRNPKIHYPEFRLYKIIAPLHWLEALNRRELLPRGRRESE